ncbi:hypothetical protein [Streptomyces sp. NPDC051572]|uniref:hypothetical protein n=1 Tax=unclassified Streptomyces TaxID=2593676 RepID=UPI003450929A
MKALVLAGGVDSLRPLPHTSAEIPAAAGDGSRSGPRVTHVPRKRPLGLGDDFVLGGIDRLAAELGPDGRVMRPRHRLRHDDPVRPGPRDVPPAGRRPAPDPPDHHRRTGPPRAPASPSTA